MTIEGHTDIAFTEDVAARFLAYGWNVLRVTDANDMERLETAYRGFLAVDDRPTLIIVHSHIGYGAPHKQDSPEAHGEPLGEDEVRLTKQFFGFDPAQDIRGAGWRARAFRRADRRTRRAAERRMAVAVRPLPRRISRTSPHRSTASRSARCRRAGKRRCRSSPRARPASRRATRRARC